VRCDAVLDVLAAHADGSPLPDGLAGAHVRRCLTCQAELARYRRVHRALEELRSRTAHPPTDLLAAIDEALPDPADRARARRLLTGRRAAYLGGIAAAATAAAGAAGAAFVLAGRSRSGRRRLAG